MSTISSAPLLLADRKLIDLSPFCSKPGDVYHKFHEPFTLGDYTYATDGRVVVRVSRRLVQASTDAAHPPEHKMLQVAPWNHEQLATAWMPIPALAEPRLFDCDSCNGNGRITKCSECDGEKTHECSCGHRHACSECNGTGRWKGSPDNAKCHICHGVGKIEKLATIELGAALVDTRFLRKIAALPAPLIAEPVAPHEPIAFKFQGGVGYLMPMRKGGAA